MIAVSMLFGAALDARAQAVREFTIDDAWGRDVVRFTSSAPLEEIVGITNELTGSVRLDLAAIRGPATQATFVVDLTTIKTGIEMRDGAVHKALGGPASKTATFKLHRVKSASADSLTPDNPVKIVAEGTFELHGVAKPLEVPATITYVPKGGPFSKMRPGNFVRITSEFDIRLSDFKVDRSGPILVLQVADTAHVTLSALASDATPEEAEIYRQSAIKYMGKARR
jgi:polyisoprenoid-binding protein YceI